MRTVRIGVVGCGEVAQRVYLPEFHRLNDKAALVAVCDRVEERARAAQQRFGARTYYTDLERFLRESDAEIVVNLTPHKAHVPVSMAALEAGRHVYTEKPLAQSVDDATQLIETARAHHVKLACAPVTLLLPTAQRWQHLLREGAIGDVTFARAQLLAPPIWDDFPLDHVWYYAAGSGPLMDVGVYALTALTGLFGPALRVSAMAGTIMSEHVIQQWSCSRAGAFATKWLTPCTSTSTLGAFSPPSMSRGACRPAATKPWKCTASTVPCPATLPMPIRPSISFAQAVAGAWTNPRHACPAATTGF